MASCAHRSQRWSYSCVPKSLVHAVALQLLAEDAIDILIQEGVYQPVRSSRWTTPVLGVVKKNGKVRMCGDYNSTMNQAIKSETYSLPTADHQACQWH